MLEQDLDNEEEEEDNTGALFSEEEEEEERNSTEQPSSQPVQITNQPSPNVPTSQTNGETCASWKTSWIRRRIYREMSWERGS